VGKFGRVDTEQIEETPRYRTQSACKAVDIRSNRFLSHHQPTRALTVSFTAYPRVPWTLLFPRR
jgi:hypothetical protein